MLLQPGLRIQFQEEKQAYTVMAGDSRFTICTKPFNPKRTVLYTIIDWQAGVRGPENLVFGLGAETARSCRAMLKRLNDKDDPSEVSHRHRIRLRLRAILKPRSK